MMIEALVAYIEAKGFRVTVYPGMLLINKGDFWHSWAIPQEDLEHRRSLESFYEEADAKMTKLSNVDFQKQLKVSVRISNAKQW